jgi:hypothetical protein
MSGFDKRREGMEAKFALDEEQKFKAIVRRNKMVGHWAAERLGLSGEAADDYAASVVKADFQEPGDQDIIRKLNADFAAKGVAVSDDQIRAELAARLVDAVSQAPR